MCGATGVRSAGATLSTGLSPRVRGNRRPAMFGTGGMRSIPACAGQPWMKTPALRSGRVYPRVCGATVLKLVCLGMVVGLSPRVRGNRDRLLQFSLDNGSIPACAGQPRISRCNTRGCSVYPRVCGATGSDVVVRRDKHGLSPRVRGNHEHTDSLQSERGSIPACAGQPSLSRLLVGGSRVYPRVCGATGLGMFMPLQRTGLSPRVRGNRVLRSPLPVLSGSIPACAGQPIAGLSVAIDSKVYPRVCGATTYSCARWSGDTGLSPRVRGNQWQRLLALPVLGSIPACAGQPCAD